MRYMLENQALGMLKQEDNDFECSLSCTVNGEKERKERKRQNAELFNDCLPSEGSFYFLLSSLLPKV